MLFNEPGANMTSQRQEGFRAGKFYTIWDNGMCQNILFQLAQIKIISLLKKKKKNSFLGSKLEDTQK